VLRRPLESTPTFRSRRPQVGRSADRVDAAPFPLRGGAAGDGHEPPDAEPTRCEPKADDNTHPRAGGWRHCKGLSQPTLEVDGARGGSPGNPGRPKRVPAEVRNLNCSLLFTEVPRCYVRDT